MAAVIGSLRAELSATVATFQQDLGKAADSVKQFAVAAGKIGKDFTQVGRQMQTVGASLTKSLTLPLAGVATAAVLAAKTVDEALDTIRAGTGATGADLDALGDSFRTVFKDVPNSAQQVADAITEVSQRTGLVGQPLETLSTQVLNLSRLTKAELKPTVEGVTRVFGDWSVASEDQAATLDLLFRATQKTGIEFGTLTELVVQFGAPMRALGFSLEETVALMGRFEKEGVNLETVMSGMRFALGKFAKAGLEPEAAFNQTAAAIKNAKTEAEATAIAFKTFGQRAAVDMSRAIIEGRFDIQGLVADLRDGTDGINAAADATLSAAEKFQRFRNNVVVALEPLGKKLADLFEDDILPMMERVIDIVGQVVDAFVKLPKPVQNALLGIGVGFAGLGPALFVGGQLVSSAGAIATAFGKTGIATRGFLLLLQGTSGLVGTLKTTTVAMDAAAVSSRGLVAAWGPMLLVLGPLLVALKLYMDEIERQNRVAKAGPLEGLKDGFGNLIVPIDKVKDGLQEVSNKVEPMGGFVRVASDALERLGNQKLGPTIEQIEAAEEAAKKAAKEAEQYAEAFEEVTQFAGDFHDIIQTVNGDLAQAIGFYLRAGASVENLAKVYGLTVAQVRAVNAQFAFQESVTTTAERGLTRIVTSMDGVNRAAAAQLAHALALRPAMQGLAADWTLVGVSVDLVGISIEHTGGLLDRTKSTFRDVGQAADAAGQRFQAARAGFDDGVQSFADGLKRLSEGEAVLGKTIGLGFAEAVGDFPSILIKSFEGGGGLEGAFKALGVKLGDVLGQAIAESIAGSVGGVIGQAIGTAVGGAIGAAIGLAIGKAVEALHITGGERVAKEVGRTFGVRITESLADQIQEDAEKMFFGLRHVAETFHLGDILAQDISGGLSEFNIDTFMGKFRDVFVHLSSGMMNFPAATKVLDENFQKFADHFLEDGELISKELVDIIHLNETWGTKSKAIADFITGQIQNKVIPGLQAFTGASSDASKGLKENEEKALGLGNELTKVEKELAGVNKERAEAAKKGDTKAYEELTQKSTLLTQQQEKLKNEIKQVNDAMDKQKAVLDIMTISSEGSANALAASVGVAFSKLQDAGVPIAQIVEKLAPVVTELGDRFAAAGYTGGAAFQQLQGIMALAKDEIAGPVLNAINGLGDTLAGLSNSGFLTQETFSGLTGQITSMYDKLKSRGADGQTALALMKKPLQTIWELQQDFGLEVDDATQGLLDQAASAGIVGDKMRPVQDQMLKAQEKMVIALNRVVEILEKQFPAAAKTGVEKVQGELDSIEAPELTVTVDVEYNDPGFTPEGASAEGFQHGSGGLRDFGSGTLAMLHGREAVVTEDQLAHMGASAAGGAVTVHLTVNQAITGLLVDEAGSRKAFREVLAPGFVTSILHDDAGIRRAIEKVTK